MKDYGAGTNVPQNYKEFFNLKHSKARNVIERAFGILKSRFAILRSHAFYSIKDQNRIIMACCMLHNFIRTTCEHDPEEANVSKDFCEGVESVPAEEFIGTVEANVGWTNWRDNMAQNMYNEWRAQH